MNPEDGPELPPFGKWLRRAVYVLIVALVVYYWWPL